MSKKPIKESGEIKTQILYDAFDNVLAASQDPQKHPAFEQLRQHLKEKKTNSSRGFKG